jgi:hypothetical protein
MDVNSLLITIYGLLIELIGLYLDTFPELTVTDEEFNWLCKHSMRNDLNRYSIRHLKIIYAKRPAINIEYNNHEIFRYAAISNNVVLCLWLESINQRYSVETNLSECNKGYYINLSIVPKSERVEYRILSHKINGECVNNFIHKEKKELCCICYDKPEELNPQCGHSFCSNCLLKSMVTSCLCPYCRQIIEYTQKIK